MGSDHFSFTEQDLKDIWIGLINSDRFDNCMRSFLNETSPVSFEDNCLKVEAAPGTITIFSRPERIEFLNKLLVEYIGISNATVQFIPRDAASNNRLAVQKENVCEEAKKANSVFPTLVIGYNNKSNSEILNQFNPNSNSIPSESIAETKTETLPKKNKNADSSALPSVTANVSLINSANNYRNSNLKNNLTFNTYVRGDNNDLAVGTAEAVAKNPGSVDYNPLFFYSGVGLGKTHLMHAIGNYILEHNPKMRVLYIPAETFMNIYIQDLQNKNMEEFHYKYRDNIDVLLIDDIQFIIDKDKTQEEFFHTFEALRGNNKQIVISSDRPPELLPKITDRMRSRMRQGMVVDIQAPKLETRIAILRQKAKERNYTVGDNIITFIAESYKANVRELEGALTKVMATLIVRGKEITLENAKTVLEEELQKNKSAMLSPETIIKAVCDYFHLSEAALKSANRSRPVVRPRHLAMYLIKENTNLTYTDIGKIFDQEHSTAMNAIEKIEKNPKDDFYKNSLTNLRDILNIK